MAATRNDRPKKIARPSAEVASWGDPKQTDASACRVYGGAFGCSYLFGEMHKVIELTALQIYHGFPDRKDRRLYIGDSCPRDIDATCPGHPEGSHAGLKNLDLNYYTLGATNATHYRPGRKDDPEHEAVNIWKKSGAVLDESLFDWERNFWCFLLISRYALHACVSMNEVIREYILEQAGKTYGRDLCREFEYRAAPKGTATAGTTWNHHLHAHVSGSKTINDIKISKIGG